MEYIGYVLYSLLVGLGLMLYREIRGVSLYDLLKRCDEEHHHIQRIIEKHPKGGDWRQHIRWMGEK